MSELVKHEPSAAGRHESLFRPPHSYVGRRRTTQQAADLSKKIAATRGKDLVASMALFAFGLGLALGATVFAEDSPLTTTLYLTSGLCLVIAATYAALTVFSNPHQSLRSSRRR